MSPRPVLSCEPFLQRFREADADSLQTGLLLADDLVAQRLAIAWTKIPVAWSRPEGDPPDALEDLWEWLWDGVEADQERLRDAAHVSIFVFGSRFTSLVDCRLIYPDGTLSRSAEVVLKAELARRYPSARPRQKAGDREPA